MAWEVLATSIVVGPRRVFSAVCLVGGTLISLVHNLLSRWHISRLARQSSLLLDRLPQLLALILIQYQAHIFVLNCLLLDSLLDVVVKIGPLSLIHPIVSTLLVHHALIELLLLVDAVTAALPVGRPAHFHQAAVIERAAHIFASIHGHIRHGK